MSGETEETDPVIKPGLFGLDLNIGIASDTETLQDVRLALDRNRNEDPTPDVYNALDCIVALIDERLPRSKNKAIRRLEAILDKDPLHLNALADLEILYRQSHRSKDADNCKVTKLEILQSNDKRNMKCKAICLLEQGYSILFEEVELYRIVVAYEKGQELFTLLQSEYRKSYGKTKDTLKEAVIGSKKVNSNLENLKDLPNDDEGGVGRIKKAIDYLQKGLKLLKSCDHDSTEGAVWQYYVAMAFNRLELRLTFKRKGQKKDEGETLKCQPLQEFWEIVTILKQKQLDKRLRFYLARSYAYIAHIFISRKELVQKYDESFVFKNDSEYKEISSDPLEACRKGMSICPEDIIVLTRYAQCLLNTIRYGTLSDSEKIRLLEKAEEFLNKCIEISPESNWLAYSVRIELCHFWTTLLEMPKDESKIKSLLERALTDGHKCYETKITGKDCNEVSQVCQELAKFPDGISCYGPDFVTNKEYLHEALIFLKQGIILQGPMNYSCAYNMGRCLYDLGEYRDAIEWMKRAMYLAEGERVFPSFQNVCFYLCTLYNSLVTPKHESEYQYLLEELLFIFQAGMQRVTDDRMIESVSSYLNQNRELQFLALVEFICNSNYRRQRKHLNIAKRIISVLSINHRTRLEKLISEAEALLTTSDQVDEKHENLDSLFESPVVGLPVVEELEIVTEDYKYDFFVSHSSNDSGWVKSILLRQLETSFGIQDKKLRGCYDGRDFVVGKRIIDNILYAIHNSRKILLILSPSFVQSYWCSYETDHSILRYITQKMNDEDIITVIPVMIEQCDVPEKLGDLTYEDLTDESTVVQKLIRLKHLLSSDV